MQSNPLTALNYRKSLTGGQTQPQVFECDDGDDWVLKLIGNPLGVASLAADWIGTALGHLLGVPMLEPGIAIVTSDSLSTAPSSVQSWAKPGPAMATRYLVQSSNVSGTTSLFSCSNLNELGGIAVLDTWIETLDRRKPDGTWNLLLDLSAEPPRALAIDQGLSLSVPLLPRGVLVGGSVDRVVLPNELDPLVDWTRVSGVVDSMLAITLDDLSQVVDSVPDEWLEGKDQRRAVVEYLDQRRSVVAELVRQRIPGG